MDRMAENEKLQMQQNAQKYKTNVVYQKNGKKSTSGVRFLRFLFPGGKEEKSSRHTEAQPA